MSLLMTTLPPPAVGDGTPRPARPWPLGGGGVRGTGRPLVGGAPCRPGAGALGERGRRSAEPRQG